MPSIKEDEKLKLDKKAKRHEQVLRARSAMHQFINH